MFNEISVVFHNGSNYDYHFIIKEFANEFEGQFESIGKNTEKNKTFSVQTENEVTNIDKDGEQGVVTISYKIKVIVQLIVQYLWQVHYHILLIISQKEFIKTNATTVIVFLNMKVSRTI